MKPVLFYTIGYPGAGKTTLASRLSYWLRIDHLRGDKIGLELFRFPTFSQEERRIVYAEMFRRAGQQLRNGKHVLYDAAVNTIAQREALEALAARNGGIAVGIWIQVPTDLAKKRAATARSDGVAGRVVRVIPPHIFDQYVAAFEHPQPHERVIRISGHASFSLQYRRLLRQIRIRGRDMPRLVQ